MTNFFRPSDFWRQLESVRPLHQGNILGKFDLSSIQRYSMVGTYPLALSQLTDRSWDKLQQTLGLSTRFTEALETAHLGVRSLTGLESTVHELNRVLPHITSWADRHWRQFKELEQLLRTRTTTFGSLNFTPTQLFTETVATIEATLKSVSVPTSLFPAVMALPNSFLSFARDQLHRIARDEEETPERANVATRVLEYSRAINLEHSALMTTILASAPNDDTPLDPAQPPYCNVLRVLNQHASPMYAGMVEVDDEALTSLLPDQIRQLSVTLVKLVLHLIELALANGRLVFHLTTRCVEALVDLTITIATDPMRFAHVVSQLYMVFHEATDKARSLKTLGNGDLGAVADVQRLRHYFFHDFENNLQRGGSSQLAETTEIFARLIGKKRPIVSSDWKRAQLALYSDLVKMLEGIRDDLIKI